MKLFDVDSDCIDVNMLTGHGEHALHIVAQSKAIWNSDVSNEESVTTVR